MSAPAPAEAPKPGAEKPAEAPKVKDAKVEGHADATHGAVDKALNPHSGTATLEALKHAKDAAAKKGILEKMELSAEEAKNDKLIHDLKEQAGDDANKHIVDEKIKAAKEKKEEKKAEKAEKKEEHAKPHPPEAAHGPAAAHDNKEHAAAHPPVTAAHPAEAAHHHEAADDDAAKPPGFLGSLFGPVWNGLRTIGAVAGFGTRLVAGVIPPLRRTKWFSGATPVEPVAKVKESAKKAAAHGSLPEAHH